MKFLCDAMVKHSTLQEWLKKKDATGHLVKEWCAWKEKDTFFCKICPATFSTAGKGFQGITQHSLTAKHVDVVKTKLNPLQLTLAGVPAKEPELQARAAATETGENNLLMKIFSRQDAVISAELQWAMKCVQSAYSNNSCDNIVDLFRSMFGNEHVPKDMSLGRTKVTYLITDALGPYFHTNMLNDAHVALSFIICFDETVNNKRAKELQFGIRFWSEKEKAVTYHHLETVFIGSATGVILSNHLMAALERASLSLHRFLMLSCDGPNVNKTVMRLVNEKAYMFLVKM
ncbi:hypothetical protein FOCC_FOCC016505 [Frankliniella occidentalis]|nr:hypothetical protein FOCC_FOCC016505 [Frankliniella occidentalis]